MARKLLKMNRTGLSGRADYGCPSFLKPSDSTARAPSRWDHVGLLDLTRSRARGSGGVLGLSITLKRLFHGFEYLLVLDVGDDFPGLLVDYTIDDPRKVGRSTR